PGQASISLQHRKVLLPNEISVGDPFVVPTLLLDGAHRLRVKLFNDGKLVFVKHRHFHPAAPAVHRFHCEPPVCCPPACSPALAPAANAASVFGAVTGPSIAGLGAAASRPPALSSQRPMWLSWVSALVAQVAGVRPHVARS